MADQPGADFGGVEELDRLINTDPSVALDAAVAWRRAVAGDPHAEAAALGAIARAYFELGRSGAAATHIRDALALCTDRTDRVVRERIAMSAAAILADAGDVSAALALLDQLEAEASDLAGRIATQRAYVLHQAGELTSALDHANRAEAIFTDSNDRLGYLRLLVCRGLIRLQQGDLSGAETDLDTADRLAEELEQTEMRAGIASNLGVVHGRARRIPAALAQLQKASDLRRSLGLGGRMAAVTELDRAEILMHSGMTGDAVAAATVAVELVEPTKNRALLGDALLLLARAQHAARQYRAAERTAADAEACFESSGRTSMLSHARSVGVHAVLARGGDAEAVRPALDRAATLVDGLTADGWAQLADELRVARVRSARAVGCLDVARDDLEHLRRGVASARRDAALPGWYAEAVALDADGDGGAALEACKAGLLILDDIVAEAPTLERRSAAMRLGADLSQLAIELAVGMGAADVALAAAEGTRARALHDELLQPGRHRPLTEDGAARLRAELAVGLGTAALVEWLVVGPDLWAVVCAGTAPPRLVRVAEIADVLRARDRMVVWLDQAAHDRSAPADGARRAAAALDDLLLGPLDLPPGAGVVVVPDGLLHGVPWSGLPSLADRPFTLTPNAQFWLQAERRAARSMSSVAMIVGPDVIGADVEGEELGRHHAHLVEATGPAATAEALRKMLVEHDLVHVSAHGSFRSDHPLLSTLRLVGGEATLYDVIPETVGAQLVVLSSCEAGAHGAGDGSEVLGFASVMLARGAAAVLAPTTTVDDVECGAFVAEVHARLAAGTEFGSATADVRRRWWHEGNLAQWAVASSFTCYGSSGVRY